ncbi:hypothetical protein ACLB2K_035668 [Fragaria x ananassa]
MEPLKHLELCALPSLRGLCSGTRIVKFPSLENLSIASCTELEGFIFDPTVTFGDDMDDNNSNENIETGAVQRFLFNNKVEIPRLMTLSLKGLTKLTAIWHSQLSQNSFSRLKDLEVHGCGNLTSIFVPSTMGRLNALDTLLINECKSVQAVFELGVMDVVEEHNTSAFTQWAHSDCENLNSVEIDSCESLQYIFPVSVAKRREVKQVDSEQEFLSGHEELAVVRCYKVEIMAEALASFQEKYESSLSTPTKQTLFSIEKKVGSNDSRNEITSPRLKHLKLSVLPRLQSFCSGNCLAKLPSLETSTMSNRLKFKIFAANDQTLQLTNEGEDTDVEAWDSTAPPCFNCSSPLKWKIVQQSAFVARLNLWRRLCAPENACVGSLLRFNSYASIDLRV